MPYGVTYLPGYNGNHETISGPDLYMLFDHSSARSKSAFDFVTWLTSAKQHLKFAIATGDLPLRQSETTAARLPDLPEEVPGGEGVRRQPRQRQARAARTSPPTAQVSSIVGTMVQSVLLGQASPDQALSDASDQVNAALAGS